MTLLPRPSSTSRSLSTDLRRFGLEWLYAPLRTGAVAPSGVALASAMTAALTEADGPVIELGPGTGVFTRALVARGIPADRIAAIEASAGFAAHLAAHHPDLRVIHGDAARIGLVKQRLAFVPLNIPPASVYLLSRRCDYSQRRA